MLTEHYWDIFPFEVLVGYEKLYNPKWKKRKYVQEEKNLNWYEHVIKDKESYVRALIAEQLGEIKSEAMIAHLVTLLCDRDSCVRWRAAYALGRMGSKAECAVSYLIAGLQDKDWAVRSNAAEALVKITNEESTVSFLMNLLDDNDSQVRCSAAQALGKIGEKASVAIPSLKKLLESMDWRLRETAAEALNQIIPLENSSRQ